MTNYVEYLRAIRSLRIIAIILGVILVIVAVARVYAMRYPMWNDVSSFTTSPTAHISKVRLPDGSVKTIVDDPVKKVHAEIVDRGYAGKQIVITEPAHGSNKADRVTIGSVNVNETNGKNGVRRTVVNTNADVDIKYFFVGALPFMLLFATFVAGPLAKENDGHLELAMTKPASRLQYALGAIAIDIGGIIATSILCFVVYVICAAMFQFPHFLWGADSARVIALSFLSSIGFYALITCVSASVKRGPGAAIGITWACALILPGLTHIDGPPGTLGAVIGGIFRTVNRLNPLSYMPGSFKSSTGEPILDTTQQLAVLASIILIIVYLAAALLQWRRVEA
ncbi:MAG: ABC transporter permease [Candidatus Eremiobacteraeota bacterium]|nr:ABC transporter permease [Candidatus Eremiobacteraeota bacterium]